MKPDDIVLIGSKNAACRVIQPTGEWAFETLGKEYDEIKELAPESDFLLAAVKITDWNGELSPWRLKAVFGNEDFGDGAKATLDFILNELIPYLESEYPCDNAEYYLCGYSLAGLFALWSAYNSNAFSGIAAVSPSVWFEGWGEYAETKAILTKKVYLSLGDREEKAKNKRLAAVGEAIRAQAALLEERGVDCTLEMNPGNHFCEPEKRLAKGIVRLVKGRR